MNDTTLDYVDFTPYDSTPEYRAKVGVGDIFINQVKHNVPECGWYIRSKNRHHYNTCKCGQLSIDGGSFYTKLVGDINNVEYHVVKYKNLSKEDGVGV